MATSGSNRVSVYECDGESSKDSSTVPLKLLWAAKDENATELYYSVAWGVVDGELILAVAGLQGIIRVLSVVGVARNLFRGHGGSVNDLQFHPLQQHILISASKDHSLRLWDCKNNVCLGRLGGVNGHRDEVLTFDIILPRKSDWDKSYGRVVSGSLDHMICVWNLDDVLKDYDSDNPPKEPKFCHFPQISLLDLHADYVDCCRYLPAVGVVASRAAKENCVVLWRPLNNGKGDAHAEVMNQLEHKNSALWWLKFGTNATGQVLAAGNQAGRIQVWRCNPNIPSIPKIQSLANGKDDCSSTLGSTTASHTTETDDDDRRSSSNFRVPLLMNRFGEELRHPRCDRAVRQVAVSRNGDRIIAATDDGRIWRWDLKEFKEMSGTSMAVKESKTNKSHIKSGSNGASSNGRKPMSTRATRATNHH